VLTLPLRDELFDELVREGVTDDPREVLVDAGRE
jgi:hypothetical protein